jgi:diguanylate cyclase (GGDEF)-like protein/PAS domain S-box-containing protein
VWNSSASPCEHLAVVNNERVIATTLGLRMLAVAGLIGVCAWFAIDLTRPAGGVTVIWLASGLLAGILLTSAERLWPAYICAALVGNLVARIVYGDPLLDVVVRSVAGTLEACIVAYALRIIVGNVTDPANLRQVARVAMTSTLLACATSALIATAASSAARSTFGNGSFTSTYESGFASHALGMVIFATLTVVARDLGTSLFGRRGSRWKFARSMTFVAVTTFGVFSQSRYPLLFLIYPPLLFAVFRHRFAGLVIGITLVVIISLAATLIGMGPLSLAAEASLQQRTLLLQVFIAVTCLTTLPVAVVLTERGRLAANLRASERNYRLLADHSRDLVVRLRADGNRVYVSPSVKEMLGWEPQELSEARWDLVHPDDRARLADTIKMLLTDGNAATVEYRIAHKDGHYVWIEALAKCVPATTPEESAEVIYSGRDISQRKATEQALADYQRQLRAITDNLPAMVMRVDAEQRYTFVNAQLGKIFGIEPRTMLGRTIREIVDEKLYASIRPHIDAALRGERVTFEGEFEANGKRYFREAHYVPDLREDGSVAGFYSMTYDITELQAAKQELIRIAQHDSLTGLGNRNKFHERLKLALAKARRNQHPIALICLDIDHFKQINDTHGHAAGDAVLCEFARRLHANVRGSDLAVRLGGDEFAILIEDIDYANVPRIVARKLIAAMEPEVAVDGASLRVTASIGIGYCHTSTDADALMLAADKALYEAKAAGRNTYRVALSDAV